MTETECDTCGNGYAVTRNVSVNYSTEKLNAPTGNPIGKFLVTHFAKLIGVGFVSHRGDHVVLSVGVNPPTQNPERSSI